MVRPFRSKAAHVTCIYGRAGGLHDFDMQSTGAMTGVLVGLGINGVLMSFLDALRSLAEQVGEGARLMIKASVLR
jgi:hypothetical protein